MGDVAIMPQPERRTRRPPGLGKLWRLCPTCKGTGAKASAPKADDLSIAPAHKCPHCAGKGMVLE